jgi:hypothetical protein
MLGSAIVVLRELFSGGAGPVGPPNGYWPKLKGLIQDLNLKNFNLLHVKNLLFNSVVADGNSGTAFTVNWSLGAKHLLTLNGNCTLTFTAPAGVAHLTIRLLQDGTGSRTVTWPASVKWADAAAPTLTTAAGASDIITMIYDGTNYWAVYGLNFA